MNGEVDAFGDVSDLGLAALLVARIEYPTLDPAPYLARLDDLAARAGVAGSGSALERLHRLRRFLFEETGFRGNAEAYFDPRNSCLNDVLDRKLGIPITLSVLMMEIGRRLGLRIDGIGLPGHFIVCVRVDGEDVLVDPYHGGTVLTRDAASEVVARVLGQEIELTEQHFVPETPVQIVARMLRNLKRIYIEQEAWTKALAVIDRMLMLETGAAVNLRDRGTVLMKLGDFYHGAADWERYLTQNPNARDAERLRGQLRRIREALASLN